MHLSYIFHQKLVEYTHFQHFNISLSLPLSINVYYKKIPIDGSTYRIFPFKPFQRGKISTSQRNYKLLYKFLTKTQRKNVGVPKFDSHPSLLGETDPERPPTPTMTPHWPSGMTGGDLILWRGCMGSKRGGWRRRMKRKRRKFLGELSSYYTDRFIVFSYFSTFSSYSFFYLPSFFIANLRN